MKNFQCFSPQRGEDGFAKITKFAATPSGTRSSSKNKYDIFINYRGKDVKDTVASLLYYNLYNKNLRVFLDNKEIEHGDKIPVKIHEAIATASVHIAIFSENYAESAWCLTELCLMVESGALIIPVFCGIKPSILRMGDREGVYYKALQKHLLTGKVDAQTVEKWGETLRDVSFNYGFQFEGDHGMILEKIAARVISHIDGRRRFEAGIFFSAVIWILIGMSILFYFFLKI